MFKHTMKAAAVFSALCLPNNLTVIFFDNFTFFSLFLKLKSNVVLSKLYLIFLT